MKAFYLIAGIAALCGCVHTHVLPPVPAPDLEQHFNSEAGGARVGIQTAGGDHFVVAEPVLSAGMVLWYDSAASRTLQRPLSDFRELRLTSHRVGTRNGLLIGAGVGAAAGAAFFIAAAGLCEGSGCSVSTRLPVFLATIPVGILVGGGVGAVVGAPARFSVRPEADAVR